MQIRDGSEGVKWCLPVDGCKAARSGQRLFLDVRSDLGVLWPVGFGMCSFLSYRWFNISCKSVDCFCLGFE